MKCKPIHIDKGARLYRRSGSDCWYLDLTVQGRRKRISLDTENKDRAMEIARPLLDEAHSTARSVPIIQDATWDEFRKSYEEYSSAHNIHRRELGRLRPMGLPWALHRGEPPAERKRGRRRVGLPSDGL